MVCVYSRFLGGPGQPCQFSFSVRQTLLAQAWREPRSFNTRYAALFAGLSTPERSARLRKVATALTHPAIPEVERHHLYVTMHHGHWQGGIKHKGGGDQRLCATCLQAGASHAPGKRRAERALPDDLPRVL